MPAALHAVAYARRVPLQWRAHQPESAIDPDLNRAHKLYQLDRHEQAAAALHQILANDPDHFDALCLMALVSVDLERFEDAEEHARRAIRVAPGQAFGHHVLARVAFSRRRLDDAKAAIEEAIRLDPSDPDSFGLLATLYASRKEWRRAVEVAGRGLVCDPEHVGCANARSYARSHLGEADASVADLEATLARDPEDAHTHANLGWSHLRTGDLDRAYAHFREALRLQPDSEWARDGVLETLRAKHWFYRPVHKFFLAMSSLQLKWRVAIIVGGYFLFRLALNLAEQGSALAPLLWAVVVAYLLFVIAVWFAGPVATTLLCFHPLARLALTRREKLGAWSTTGVLAAGATCAALGVVGDDSALFTLGIAGVFLAVLLVITFDCDQPKAQRTMFGYTAAVGVVGALWVYTAFAAQALTREIQPTLEQAQSIVREQEQLAEIRARLATADELDSAAGESYEAAERDWRERSQAFEAEAARSGLGSKTAFARKLIGWRNALGPLFSILAFIGGQIVAGAATARAMRR